MGFFFRNLESCFFYNFQVAFLKEETGLINTNSRYLDEKGTNLKVLLYNMLINKDQETSGKFRVYLEDFEPAFRGIIFNPYDGDIEWQFNLGGKPPRLESFPATMVSEGILKASAIALLCSMPNPPAVVMLEEIENGISQYNLSRFLNWLRQTSNEGNTQFIFTTHSLSVLRQFADYLDEVYYVWLNARQGYKSMVHSLNSSMSSLVDLGTLEGEYEERNGKKVVKIAPIDLTELW